MNEREDFIGRQALVSFDGAENIALWFTDPASEVSTRIMLDEMPEFIEYLKYWMPGLFEGIWMEGMAYGVNYDAGDYEIAPEPIENPYRRETE